MNCDSNSRSEIIESLREVVPEILHTKDGSRVAMHCVWHGDNKVKKKYFYYSTSLSSPQSFLKSLSVLCSL